MKLDGSRLGLTCVIVALLGCAKFKSMLGQDSPDAAASGSAQTAAAAPPERVPGPDDVCSAGERKVWGKWANRRTGLTPTRIGGNLVIGVAIGNTPHLLLLDNQGGGKLTPIRAPAGSALAKDLRAPDVRDLHRVTPAKSEAGITAYADYRDKYRDGRRRIACGSAESARALLAFDGKPLIDPEETKKPDKKDDKPDAGVAATKPDAGALAALPRLKLPKRAGATTLGGSAAPAAPAAPAATPAPPATPPPAAAVLPVTRKKPAVSEIRDCRTFVDDDGSVWAVASELRGEPQDDDSHKWSMRFFAAPDSGRGYVTLHSVALGKDPKKLSTFETPVGASVGDGHVVFARYQGSLFGWGLGAGFRPSGGMRVFRGGYPTMPHLIPEGPALWTLTSMQTTQTAYELRGTKLTGTRLPATIAKLTVAGSDASGAEPTLARAGEQRWLSYQAGARREGRLVIVPVDAELNSVGKAFDVTSEGSTVYESHIFGLGEGKLLAVYIQNSDAGAELVSQPLTCAVKN